MAVTDALKSLVDQMPPADGRGMYTENMDKEKIEKAAAEIAKGGPSNVAGLIEMLGEAGSAENVKPHYALHCVMNYPLVVKDEGLRKSFCETVAAQVTNEKLSPYNRAYLCQELQWSGRDESCSALGKVLLDETLSDRAAMALTAIGGERAASQLRDAARQAKGKCRLNLIDALAALADASSVALFKDALQDEDAEIRIAAGAGLASVGDPSAVDPLLKAADCPAGWERGQQAKHCLILAEKLTAAGKKAEAAKVYQHLRDTRSDASEGYLREAAAKALAAVA